MTPTATVTTTATAPQQEQLTLGLYDELAQIEKAVTSTLSQAVRLANYHRYSLCASALADARYRLLIEARDSQSQPYLNDWMTSLQRLHQGLIDIIETNDTSALNAYFASAIVAPIKVGDFAILSELLPRPTNTKSATGWRNVTPVVIGDDWQYTPGDKCCARKYRHKMLPGATLQGAVRHLPDTNEYFPHILRTPKRPYKTMSGAQVGLDELAIDTLDNLYRWQCIDIEAVCD